MNLTPHDEATLSGVMPALVAVVWRAAQITAQPFAVVWGRRTQAQEDHFLAVGLSQTRHSKHLIGAAVDLAALDHGKISWDGKLYPAINDAMQSAAAHLNTEIIWGGSWHTLKDLGHWELALIQPAQPQA